MTGITVLAVQSPDKTAWREKSSSLHGCHFEIARAGNH
jgi:hypothetical protein